MKGIFILILSTLTFVTFSVSDRVAFASERPILITSVSPGSQDNDSLKIWDKVDIQSDSRIKELLHQHVSQNKKNNVSNGYRVQIYFGSGANAHAQALKVRTEFMSSYPSVKAYLIFKSPDFKVVAGNFRTKSEALKLQKSISGQFPNAFIVADEISLTELSNSK